MKKKINKRAWRWWCDPKNRGFSFHISIVPSILCPIPLTTTTTTTIYTPLSSHIVAREAFDHAKNAASIISDNEINSDGEPDDIEVENGTPVVKKRKSFFGFSAVATSHEKKKADGITTEVSTEQKKDLTHVQEGDVDALKTHESENAVSHTTDAVTPPAAPESPKSPKAKSGGFKLFGKKPAKEEPAPPPAPAPHPLTVDEAKEQALKAVDDAVAASKAKEVEAKKETPPAPPAPEKKPGFLAGLFGKKPVRSPFLLVIFAFSLPSVVLRYSSSTFIAHHAHHLPEY